MRGPKWASKIDLRAADLALPPRIISLRRNTMDIKETGYLNPCTVKVRRSNTCSSGAVMNNYASIFDLFTCLRWAADHPYLVVYSNTAAQRAGSIVNGDQNNDGQVCSVCHDHAEGPVVTACARVFCKACLFDFFCLFGSHKLLLSFSLQNNNVLTSFTSQLVPLLPGID